MNTTRISDLLAEELHLHLLDYTARIMDRRLKTRIDPEDVLQSVYRTFFRRLEKDEFPSLMSGDLRGLLITIIRRKLVNLFEFHTAGVRDVRRETAGLTDFVAHRPPEQICQELRDLCLAQCPDEDREIVGWWLDGVSVDDIAVSSGFSRRTTFRVLERCRRRLTDLLSQNPEFVP